jgi:hypothetical protein
MLKLPPPFWALAYTLIAIGASYLMGWPRVTGLPLVWLGVVLVVLGIGLSVTAAMLFRRDGTEINPTSPANRKLVTSGPFRLTRNPMYLGLVLVTLGIALGWPVAGVPCSNRHLRHRKLGAYSVRGGENASPVWCVVRRLRQQDPAVDLNGVRSRAGSRRERAAFLERAGRPVERPHAGPTNRGPQYRLNFGTANHATGRRANGQDAP